MCDVKLIEELISFLFCLAYFAVVLTELRTSLP